MLKKFNLSRFIHGMGTSLKRDLNLKEALARDPKPGNSASR